MIPPPAVVGEQGLPSSAGAHLPRALAPGGGGFLDRREDAGAAALTSELPNRVAEVRASASRCLDGWPEEDPSLAAGVMLAFSLDGRGLQEVWINDHAEVPSGALA